MYRVEDLVKEYSLEVVSGEKGLPGAITIAQVSRPGLELAGLFEFYEHDRVQVLGSKEVTFYGWLNESDKDIRVRMLFEQKPPAFIFSRNAFVPDVFKKYSSEFDIPVLKSTKKTSALLSSLYLFLSSKLSERISQHGTLLDVNGVGVMIRGKSGLGKSEVALELVRRGHQLVADDRVDIYQREKGVLVGEAPEILKKHLEIRGIGIVNVVHLFGVKAFKENKKIMLVADLELWDNSKNYDRLGIDSETLTYFETEVAHIRIPVSPGRNIASLIEVAAMNARLKYLGTNSAQEFADSVQRKILENTTKE
jgi:HPr kinase/phosphorylase